MWWQIWLPSRFPITILDLRWLPVEWILVCLYYFTFWMENFPVYIPHHRPGSVGLSSRLWDTMLFVYWWPAEWRTSHMSGTLVGFVRKQRPRIQIQRSYSSYLLCSVAPSWSWIHYWHYWICAVSDHQCGVPRVNSGLSKASIHCSSFEDRGLSSTEDKYLGL